MQNQTSICCPRLQGTLNRFADIALGWEFHGVERLDSEFTRPVFRCIVISEFPSEPLGAGNLSDAAMLIPLTIDSHLATLHGVEDVVIVSTMVLCGVCECSNSL